MKSKVMGFFSKERMTKGFNMIIGNKRLRLVSMAAVVTFIACGPTDTGDLTGVQGRSPWFHPEPPGTVYVKTGTFHTGQGSQDIFQSYLQPNKQMTIVGFWMDETEITNNEYRQFVAYVIDSIARMKLYDDDEIKEKIVPSVEKGGGTKLVAELFKKPNPEDEEAEGFDPNAPEVPFINHDEALDWEQKELHKLLYAEMFYQGEERFRGKRQIDVSKLKYHYQWFDLVLAANSDKNRDKYKPQNRKDFIKDEDVLIYPDTLCWIRDFTYSFNEPMARVYFWHPRYDDYPVVGVNWAQARAFCHWRSYQKEAYWEMNDHLPNTENFRLPTEYEWEYAARGGRIGNKYPWGGPYARNGKGCMLANFKPMRGDYGASDGGVYPVRADSYFPNDFGLYNMSGNVSEWTQTKWDESTNTFSHDLNGNYDVYYKEHSDDAQEQAKIAKTPINQKRKVIRGGSWKDVAYYIECGARTYEFQDTSKCYVGFRCVQTYIGRSSMDKK